jgi:NADH-quinone oxidoreductase subunit C
MSPWEGAEYILPGDEKAHGQAPGAPSPAASPPPPPAAAASSPPKVDVPKTTATTAQTGAGEPANVQAAKRSPAKKRADAEGVAPAKPKATRKPKTPGGDA